MSLKEFWSHTDNTLGIPSMHLCKQSKREFCSFDPKYKQKNKPIFNITLKFPCGTQRKSSVQYMWYMHLKQQLMHRDAPQFPQLGTASMLFSGN